MYVWILKPRNVDEQSWRASSHHGVVLVRAPDERTAREEAQKAFGVKTRFPPNATVPGPVWLRADLVDAEIAANVPHDPEGPVGVIEPSFEADLKAPQ